MTFDLIQFTKERFLIVGALRDGDPKPLAGHLAAGGELHDDQREALIKYLRGEYRRKRGNPHTAAQHWKVLEIRQKVIALQSHFALLYGSRGSLRRALEAYLEHNPDIGEESLKSYVKRGIPKEWLQMIDEVRSEVLERISESKD